MKVCHIRSLAFRIKYQTLAHGIVKMFANLLIDFVKYGCTTRHNKSNALNFSANSL